jgi:hypothetical protein
VPGRSTRSRSAERLASFALELHPEKTRLIESGRFAQLNRHRRGSGKAQTFMFLGFTHYCPSNSKGYFVVGGTTRPKRKRPKFPSGAEWRLGVTIGSWFSQRDWEQNVVFAGGDRLQRSGGS